MLKILKTSATQMGEIASLTGMRVEGNSGNGCSYEGTYAGFMKMQQHWMNGLNIGKQHGGSTANFLQGIPLMHQNKLKVVLWVSGTLEQFLLHVRTDMDRCKQIDLDTKAVNAMVG